MMRNIHFFDLAPGADERRALELWDGVLAEAAVAPATAVTELPCLHHARNVLCTGVLLMHL